MKAQLIAMSRGTTARKQQREADRAERRLAEQRSTDAWLVEAYLSNGIRTSGGTGPGTVLVPPDEAARLVSARLAIYGASARVTGLATPSRCLRG